jgi:imidazolonepropionase-like amidohydrolase
MAPPWYPEDILAGSEGNQPLAWCPTVEPLFLAQYTADTFPERLNIPASSRMPPAIAADIRDAAPSPGYFTLVRRRIRPANKFRHWDGRTMPVGTDSDSGNFHPSTWRELETWVKLGVPPIQAISSATRWPAAWLKREKDFGTIAPGRYADIIAVRGDVLSNIGLLQRLDVILKGGARVR